MSLTQFGLIHSVEGGETVVTISGPIDETSNFDPAPRTGRIRINLAGVTRINSIGTRAWCLWMKDLRAPVELTLVDCPVVMVKNFTTINGFLSPHAKVLSFKVPFYSKKTSERRDVTVLAADVQRSGPKNLPAPNDSQGGPMELDSAESYFNFIKKA